MAGTRSVLGYVQRQDANAFEAERPLSALQTLILRNNTQHLVDMSCQYRFNWVASTSEAGFGAIDDLAPGRSQFCVVFPVTITDPNTVPSLDIRFGTRCTNTLTSGTVQATLSDVSESQPLSRDAFEVFTVSSATPAWHDWVLDLNVPWSGRRTAIVYQDITLSGGTDQSTTVTSATCILLKLVINAFPTDPSDGDLTICAVQIREYLSQ